MKRITVFVILLLIVPFISADISISELMFNPSDGNEWVELFISGNITHNISELLIKDNLHTDNIVCCDFDMNCDSILPQNTFIIIFDQDTSFNTSDLEPFYCVDDNAIGNGLGNSNDQVIISEHGIVLSNITYTTPVKKGNSLSLINRTWIETFPTPGMKNMVVIENVTQKINSTDLSIQENLPNKLFTDNEYNSLFVIKNLDYPEINERINLTFYYNISRVLNTSIYRLVEGITTPSLNFYTTKNTGHFLFNISGRYMLCGEILNATFFDYNLNNNILCLSYNVSSWKNVLCNLSLSIDIEKQIYELGEKVEFYNTITNKTFPFKIQYWVEDLFGETVKNKVETTNTNKKSYTPKIEEQEKVFIIKNNLDWVACNNTNNKTHDEKLFVVKGQRKDTSRLEIEKLYLSSSNKASFGDSIRIKLNIYKGDTNKNSLKSYIEKNSRRISYTTYFNLYEKFQNYELTIPIQLKPNCNNNYGASSYYLYVEGLDKKIKEKISINGHKKGVCGLTIINDSEVHPEKTTNKLYELINYSFDKIDGKIIVKLNINNPTEHNHSYSVWSYVYKGRVSFSGDRKKNKIIVNLNKTLTKTLFLENNLSNVSGGNFKLKIKVLRDDRKTPYEIIEDIYVYNLSYSNITEVVTKEINGISSLILKNSTLNLSNKITGNIIYASSSEKIKNYALFLVIFIMFLAAYAWFMTR